MQNRLQQNPLRENNRIITGLCRNCPYSSERSFIIADKYDALGQAQVEPLFADPHTHTSLAGAEMNASCVVAGLKALLNDLLAPYFSAKAAGVSKAEAGKPLGTAGKSAAAPLH